MNKLKFFIVKMNRHDNSGGFFICLSEYLYTFVETQFVMRSSDLFWKLLNCQF